MKDLTEKDKKGGYSSYFKFLRFIEKITKKSFLIKLGIFTIFFIVIFFPTQTGDLLGTWYHKLTQAFNDATN